MNPEKVKAQLRLSEPFKDIPDDELKNNENWHVTIIQVAFQNITPKENSEFFVDFTAMTSVIHSIRWFEDDPVLAEEWSACLQFRETRNRLVHRF